MNLLVMLILKVNCYQLNKIQSRNTYIIESIFYFMKFNKKINKKKINLFFVYAFILLGFSLIIYNYSPDEIVEFLGMENGYLIVLVLGFLGGISIMFPVPYYLFVITFGAGGLNPIILGIFSGLGVICGETTSYLLAYHGRVVLSEKYQKLFDRTFHVLNKKNNYFIIAPLLFLYGTFIPIPNDFITLSFGAIRYNYWKLIIPFGLGNMLFNIILAYGGFSYLNAFF